MTRYRYLTLLLSLWVLLAVALQCERDGRGIAAAAFAPQEAVLPVLEAVAGDSAPLVWFWWAEDEEPIIVPSAWAEHAYAVGECESGWQPDAVGALNERGIMQLHPIHLRAMREYGYDPEWEADRLAYAVSLWGWSGETWRYHWQYCARIVGAP